MDLTGLLVISAGVLVFMGVFSTAYVLLAGRPNLEKRIQQQGAKGEKERFQWRSYLMISWAVLKPLGEMIPRSPQEMSRQERRLVQAGIRRSDGPLLFNGAKLVLILIFLVASIVTGLLKTNPLLYPVLSLLLGSLLPDMWLNRKIADRKDRIQLGLPDALDLIVLCVEAGLGLDSALADVIQGVLVLFVLLARGWVEVRTSRREGAAPPQTELVPQPVGSEAV